jgi:polysaccharide biosynthesis/export protein
MRQEMRSRSILVALWLLCLLFPIAANAQAAPYAIHPDDQFQLSVFGAQALSTTVTVLSDGTITVPLVGQLHVGGLSPNEALHRLTEALSAYVQHPVITFVLVKGTPTTVEVLGSVDRNGPVEIQDGDRLADAIAKAGVGPDTHADLNHITVNRLEAGVPHLYNVNLYNMLLNADYASNMQLKPGDVVYVPKARQYNISLLPISLFYLYLIGAGYHY